MSIYLIRHGETDWNIEGRFQGHENIPLNEKGLSQAEGTGEALKNVHLSAIHTSPLIRARQTAECIAARQCCPLVIDDALIERYFGKLSGLLPEERQAFIATGQPDGVEPREEVAARALTAINAIEDAHPGENVAVVTHGAWINALLAELTGGRIGSGKTLLKNACISLLRRDETGWHIPYHNVTAGEFGQYTK